MTLNKKSQRVVKVLAIVGGVVSAVGMAVSLFAVMMVFNIPEPCSAVASCGVHAIDQTLDSASLIVNIGNKMFYVGLALMFAALIRVIYGVLKKTTT